MLDMVQRWVPSEICGSTMVNHGQFVAQPWWAMVENHGVTFVSHGRAMVFSQGECKCPVILGGFINY